MNYLSGKTKAGSQYQGEQAAARYQRTRKIAFCKLTQTAKFLAVNDIVKIELHCHTAPRSHCAGSTPDELLSVYSDAGYGAVFITDHDTVWPEEDIKALQARHPRIRIFPGIERSIGNLGDVHLLILGTNDPSYLETDDPAVLIPKARSDGYVTVLAHPCIRAESANILKIGIFPDAIEYRTGSQGGRHAEIAKNVAYVFKLPLLNSGDVHHTTQINQFWIETAAPLTTIDDLRDIIFRGTYQNRVSDQE